MLVFTRKDPEYPVLTCMLNNQIKIICNPYSDYVGLLTDENVVFTGTVERLRFDGFTYNITFKVLNHCITHFNVTYTYGNLNVPKLTQVTIQKLVDLIQEQLPMDDFTIYNKYILTELIKQVSNHRETLIYKNNHIIANIKQRDTEIATYESELKKLTATPGKKPSSKKTK